MIVRPNGFSVFVGNKGRIQHGLAVPTGRPHFARSQTELHRSRASSRSRCVTNTSVSEKSSSENDVKIEIEKSSWNSRKIYASVVIAASVDTIWQCLSDYEQLSSFVPSLVENKCLEKKQNGAILYQVGAQEVAMGVRFSANCTLDCTEYPSGIPNSICSENMAESGDVFPFPKAGLPETPSKDISFKLIDGDFEDFRGIWRMQPLGDALDNEGVDGVDVAALLSYALYVKPQAWLPVRLVQGRIQQEVVKNLFALKKYAEQKT